LGGEVWHEDCTSGLVTIGTVTPTTCVVNAYFSPARPRLTAGAVVLNSTTGLPGASTVSGTGTGAGLAIDPGTATVTGTWLAPSGIAVDGDGRVYTQTDTTDFSLAAATTNGCSGAIVTGTACALTAGFNSMGHAAGTYPFTVTIDSGTTTLTMLPFTLTIP
jgi:hypothetical protein